MDCLFFCQHIKNIILIHSLIYQHIRRSFVLFCWPVAHTFGAGAIWLPAKGWDVLPAPIALTFIPSFIPGCCVVNVNGGGDGVGQRWMPRSRSTL